MKGNYLAVPTCVILIAWGFKYNITIAVFLLSVKKISFPALMLGRNSDVL